MTEKLRDICIILWVVGQGSGWFFPDVYGQFYAQVEYTQMNVMDQLMTP